LNIHSNQLTVASDAELKKRQVFVAFAAVYNTCSYQLP